MTLYLGNNLISGVATPTEPTRNLGQIIESIVPLTDAGLHLLDGSLIQGSGIYSAFVTYIAGLVSTYPNLFITESAWQTAVTTYGVCGKFVYDSVNNTVRLPKITGIIEGTTDVSALGDLVEAGLPNVKGRFHVIANNVTAQLDSMSGAFTGYYPSGTWNYTQANNGSSSHNAAFADFDASRSSSLYKNNFNKVQPQTIKTFYYIVIATSTKTDIQVDIDEVTTDLNGKADVDLTNCTKPHIVETYINGTSWYRIYSDGFCIQGGRQTASTTKVSLLVNYANTNYTVITNSGYNNTNAIYNQFNPYVLYVDGFGVTWTDALRFNQWVAYGYTR